ncbi:hypothetical protein RZN22_13490 [Bacillaceae bacterium S4-13-58]
MSANSHHLALRVENAVRNALDCDRFGFGGIADADFIERLGYYTAFSVVLDLQYQEKRDSIDEFLQKYYDLSGININGNEDRFRRAIDEFMDLVR